MRWSKRQELIAIANFKKIPYRQISSMLGKSEKSISGRLCKSGYKKCPNYTEMEIYMLQNFPVRIVSPFIPHKSFNALKIKKCRICKCIPANVSIQ